jgi:uncharacterized protein (TIGR03435 family)
MRESSVYALVVAKGGPKIKLARDQTSADLAGAPASPGDGPNHGGILMAPGMLVANAVPLSRFAKVLAPELDRSVVDRTNLNGRFDIQLRWAPDAREAPDGDFPSIFTAIQEQLGLKLESARGPVEFLIVDQATRPSEN